MNQNTFWTGFNVGILSMCKVPENVDWSNKTDIRGDVYETGVVVVCKSWNNVYDVGFWGCKLFFVDGWIGVSENKLLKMKNKSPIDFKLLYAPLIQPLIFSDPLIDYLYCNHDLPSCRQAKWSLHFLGKCVPYTTLTWTSTLYQLPFKLLHEQYGQTRRRSADDKWRRDFHYVTNPKHKINWRDINLSLFFCLWTKHAF